jgi:hypothetical protein
MRIETRRLGTRFRVILNKSEVRQIAFQILIQDGLIEEDKLPKNAKFHIINQLSGYYLNSQIFEKKCREFAELKIDIPNNSNFRIGFNECGEIVGATFQFFRLENLIFDENK